MNRWWGNQADSSRQASERDQRAARRTIASLNINPTSDEEEFADCETSINLSNLNLDGNGDIDSTNNSVVEEGETSSATMPDEVPFDMENKDDDAEAWKKDIKVKFDRHDVQYSINAIESAMKKNGINKQWSKKDAMVTVLPDDIIEECKPILRLSEEDQGAHIYKDLKDEILNLFGPRDEDAFKKAIALRLTGKPSGLGKKLIHTLCPGPKPFTTCHCARIVFGFWEAQLTAPIRSRLAGKKFTAQTYESMFKLADEAWLANGGASTTPTVVAAVTSPTEETPSTEAVSALSSRGRGQFRGQSRGRGGGQNRGNRGGFRGGRGTGRGGNNSNQNQNQGQNNQQGQKPHQKGPRAAPDVPDNACSQHWKAGRNATYCTDPLNCDWVRIIAPRAST